MPSKYPQFAESRKQPWRLVVTTALGNCRGLGDLCCAKADVNGLSSVEKSRVLTRVLKIEICELPNVFECSRVLKLAINASEMLCYQSVIPTVTIEAVGSIPDSSLKRQHSRDHHSARLIDGQLER